MDVVVNKFEFDEISRSIRKKKLNMYYTMEKGIVASQSLKITRFSQMLLSRMPVSRMLSIVVSDNIN